MSASEDAHERGPRIPMIAPAPAVMPALDTHRLRRILLAAGAVFAVLFLVGVVPRLMLRHRLRTDADAVRTRLPMVSTTNPRRAPEVLEIPLPGSMEAILETGIWARTNGYLKARYVDIGDRVRKGQQLADIDTPVVDAGRATVNADEANVRLLLELQSFQKVYAPFDGIITVRNVDPGSLISAGSTTGTTELFTLAQVDILRIFVFVPQSYAPDIKVGQTADVSVRELPGRVFQGTVARTAGAIDATSRTLLTEVHVPNPDGLLLSGSYATVRFKVQRPNPSLLVPQSALLIDASGVRVAVVNADGTLHYQPVQIGRDFGNDVEVLSGVDTTNVLAAGLAANIAEGSRVDIAKPANTTTGAAKP